MLPLHFFFEAIWALVKRMTCYVLHLNLQVRFDDTNPTKEKDEYVENIIKDMQTLGLQYKTITYTSDYFPQVQQQLQFQLLCC
jgi:glutamyl/glutaminyl-tRNA synthetase